MRVHEFIPSILCCFIPSCPENKSSQMTGRGWRKSIIFLKFPFELLVLAKHHPKPARVFGHLHPFQAMTSKTSFFETSRWRRSRNAVKNGPTWSKWCFWQPKKFHPIPCEPQTNLKDGSTKTKEHRLDQTKDFLKTCSNTGSEKALEDLYRSFFMVKSFDSNTGAKLF